MPFLVTLAAHWRRCARAPVLICALFLGAGSVHAGEAREVRVGVYPNAPKIFLDGSGKPSGIFIDLLEEIAAEEGWRLRYVTCAWQACLDALGQQRIDLMPDVAYSEERERLFDFHRTPALYSWSQIYARADAQVESTFDLAGKRIAVLGGSIQESAISGMLDAFGLKASLVSVGSLDEAFRQTQAGAADVAISNVFFGDYNARRFGLRDTPIVFQPARLFFATAQGRNADLLMAIERNIDGWRGDPDSVYYRIQKKWRGMPAATIPAYVWQVLAAVSFLLLVALAIAALLRRQVAQKVTHLLAAQARMAAVFEAIPDLLCELDLDGRYYDYHAPRSARKVDAAADMIGRRVSDVLPTAAAAQVLAALHAAQASGYAQGFEFSLEPTPGEVQWYELSVACKAVGAADAPRFIVLSRNITARKRAEDDVRYLAFYDTLTGLPNRRLMQDRLTHAIANCERRHQCGGLLMLDLDNFKTLNDTLGHEVGDQLLLEVAARLRACVRDGDTIARMGGDEFVVILEGLDDNARQAAAQAEAVAQKIQAALTQTYQLRIRLAPELDAARVHECTASIGLCLFHDRAMAAEEIIKRADTAMYQSKAAGRDTLRFYDPDMQAAMLVRAALEVDLRGALAQGQLLLHYQAQIDHRGMAIGAECLLRWQHPQRQLVPPGEFIALAEETGLILPIGQWVLDTACRQLRAWSGHAEFGALTLAVNVSARQFRQGDFVERVHHALHHTGANPERLKLELTESLLVDDVEDIIRKMSRLKALGVTFSLDDFGTGYSSLSYLKRLPLDQLKIDQSFVRDVFVDPNNASIARTIVALGRSLGLSVVAEGVESLAQRDFLAASGCHIYQGYYFSRPLPLAEFEAWLGALAPAP